MTDDEYTMGEFFRDVREERRKRRERLGVDCPGCPKVQPKRIPTVLLPQQRCKVCGYRDPRARDDRAALHPRGGLVDGAAGDAGAVA
jgi:hypothetical protein